LTSFRPHLSLSPTDSEKCADYLELCYRIVIKEMASVCGCVPLVLCLLPREWSPRVVNATWIASWMRYAPHSGRPSS